MHSFFLLMHHVLISNLVSFNFFLLFMVLSLKYPYLHLREFEEVCNTCTDQNCSMNIIRLNIFPFSLKDKAKTWLQILGQDLAELGMKCKHNFWKNSSYPTKQILLKNKSQTSLKNQEKPSINVGIGLKNYLTFDHTIVLKHGD